MSELTEMAETILHLTEEVRPATTIAPMKAHPMPPIGLSGFAQAGKTAAALWIESTYGYRRQHIAEPLRRMLASLLREYDYNETKIERYLTGDLKEAVVPEFGATSRQLQITLGTEWMREQVNPDGWAKLWAYQAARSSDPVMNDSVRFPNEETAVHGAGGFTIMIKRPGTGPMAYKWKRVGPILYRWFGCMWGVHDSERVDRLKPDFVIVNDGTLDELHSKIAEAIHEAQCGLAHPGLCA